VLDARTRLLGADHPDTLLSIFNMARINLNQNRLAEAERFYKRALAGQERTLGPIMSIRA
jgi:hypothetical protein